MHGNLLYYASQLNSICIYSSICTEPAILSRLCSYNEGLQYMSHYIYIYIY